MKTDISIFVCRCDVLFWRYAVSSAEVARKVVKNWMFFLRSKFEGKGLKIFGGICKSTSLLTYWPSLVEILWLVFHLC